MIHNKSMKKLSSISDAVHLIRFVSVLWIGYLVALAIINLSLGPPQRSNDVLYYVLHGLIVLVCLGLAYWSWLQERLRGAFVPFIVAIVVVMPILINWLMINLFPVGPRFFPDNSLVRPFPFLFLGILLVAWQYSWPYVVLVSLAISALNLGVMWSFGISRNMPIQGALADVMIQTFIFLAVGFSINYLMGRLGKQQESLESAHKNLTHYASTLEELTTSRERNRLARELHDTLAHTLSGLSVQLETVKAYWDVDLQAAHALLEKSLAAAHSGLEETRRALKALRASPLDDLGLALAISRMAEEAAKRANLKLELSVPDQMPALSPDVEQSVYRIVQEAVTNVVNHAQAKNLSFAMEYVDGKLNLTVRDDGVGFDVDKNSKAGGFGLIGMRERAEVIGGNLKITGKPGFGTTIELTV
jgi:signal transduction histidine kinase